MSWKNLVYTDPVKIAVDGWMKSKGHRENILADFRETGIGTAITKDGKFYMTQLFSKFTFTLVDARF